MQDEEGGIRYLAGEGKNETVFNTIRCPGEGNTICVYRMGRRFG